MNIDVLIDYFEERISHLVTAYKLIGHKVIIDDNDDRLRYDLDGTRGVTVIFDKKEINLSFCYIGGIVRSYDNPLVEHVEECITVIEKCL